MRILQIIPSISLVYGGPSQMVLGLSAALAKEGVDVTILTTNSNGDTGQAPLDVPLNQPVEQNGYRVIYFPCSPFRRYKFSLDLLRWLNAHAHEFDIAHLHALFSPVISAAATVARNKRLPYILRPLGTLDPADLQKKKQLKKIYTALWERGNIAGSAAIHFTSQQEAKISERFGVNTNDLIIPLGVQYQSVDIADCDVRTQLDIPPDIPLLLFLSRIEPKKGLNLLLPALETLLAEGLTFHFVLAGSNPQDPDYEAMIAAQVKASALAKCTTMTGFVTGEFKAALLQQADLFVLPSYYENFGIAVAEAMAAGTAVCISRGVYIWSDVQAANAGWVCNCEVEDLVSQLREALLNLDECHRRGINGQGYANQGYRWQAIAQETIKAYQEIVA
jgi:glycosyltransferase involved in cell wall biosynthesis